MTKLSKKQEALLRGLCELTGGMPLTTEGRRIAGPLVSKGLVMWFGFGNFRAYQATDKGRAFEASRASLNTGKVQP